MYSRKLHVDGEDPQRLYRALRELYSDGVRIPFGKPYVVRKNARRSAPAVRKLSTISRDTGGLTLVEESREQPAGWFPQG